MNELALFAGIGGGLLASRLLGWRTVAAVEIDKYCRKVLFQRQREGHLDRFPIWDDIGTFDGRCFHGLVDVVSAGFPCQPFSVAGKRAGESDPRNMWPDTIRVIRQVRPRFCFLENVPGLLVHEYFGTILGDLAESGYDIRWRCLSAAELGAPHYRRRLWILAYSGRSLCTRGIKSKADEVEIEEQNTTQSQRSSAMANPKCRRQQKPQVLCRGKSQSIPGSSSVANTQSQQDRRESESRIQSNTGTGGWWDAEPSMGRVAYGVSDRVGKLRGLGNAQVPIVAATAYRLLTGQPQPTQDAPGSPGTGSRIDEPGTGRPSTPGDRDR